MIGLMLCAVSGRADTPQPTEASVAIAKLRDLAKGDADELIAAMQAFDTTYATYRLEKAPGTTDILYATKGLMSFIGRYARLMKSNPEEAQLFVEFINSEIKFLKDEFKPNEKMKDVFLNTAPPVNPGRESIYSGMPVDAVKNPEARRAYKEALNQNRLNAIYNERQSRLWSFFRFIEFAKQRTPELTAITDAGCDLEQARKAAYAQH